MSNNMMPRPVTCICQTCQHSLQLRIHCTHMNTILLRSPQMCLGNVAGGTSASTAWQSQCQSSSNRFCCSSCWLPVTSRCICTFDAHGPACCHSRTSLLDIPGMSSLILAWTLLSELCLLLDMTVQPICACSSVHLVVLLLTSSKCALLT